MQDLCQAKLRRLKQQRKMLRKIWPGRARLPNRSPYPRRGRQPRPLFLPGLRRWFPLLSELRWWAASPSKVCGMPRC